MYQELSDKIKNKIKNEKPNLSFADENAIRRIDNAHDYANELRSNFIRDIDKIMNCPFFPRYADKTQVLSFYKNDDITHRSMHIQFVSRIARTIGKALNLNLELIEAIAIGHDIGHTPFGHSGEYALDEIYYVKTKKHFYHNLHSVRVLDKIFPLNLTLQTLDGILCHDGELELNEYHPSPLKDFDEFDKRLENCYKKEGYIKTLSPCTLEGAVVRISDIIAYLGKDRQDAIKTNNASDSDFTDSVIGSFNAEIINNLTVNLIENSFGKDYLCLDKEHFTALQEAKRQNYQKIYYNNKTKNQTEKILFPMMSRLFDKLLEDLKNNKKDSPIFTHHIDYVNSQHYSRKYEYEKMMPEDIVVDYIASMTDDYFIDLYNHLFKDDKIQIQYKGYFD
ncbi:MAG: HD domain-containing protein [Clostridia bacterium]|nr:HD domain-containing protein [Clostridia bacterium]